MIIAVDFDGTCVSHDYPYIGKEIGAAPVLRELVAAGHDLILFTMRDGKLLKEAEAWFKENKIRLMDSNRNKEQTRWTSSPKVHADLYIDDSALGIPANARNKEMCAVIIEALSWESYYSVYPVFYETILLNRAARDEQSKEMLKIIFNTRSYDPGLYWDLASGLHGNEGLLRLSATNSSDIASLWAKYSGKLEENFNEVNDWIADKED